MIDVAPSTAAGAIDVEALAAMIDDRVKLIATTWIPTNGGLVNPAAEIGRVAKAHQVPYLLDACQAVGQMPIDVAELGCDFLSATGRKFLRGPRGTGFLWVRDELITSLEPAMIDHFAADWVATNEYELRADARRFENWETNYAGKLGLGAAVDYALGLGIQATSTRICGLGDMLRTSLDALERVSVHDKGATLGGIVTFAVDGVDAADVHAQLSAQNINTSTSPPGHAWLDLPHRSLPTLVRASVHYYNSEDEIDRFIGAVDRVR